MDLTPCLGGSLLWGISGKLLLVHFNKYSLSIYHFPGIEGEVGLLPSTIYTGCESTGPHIRSAGAPAARIGGGLCADGSQVRAPHPCLNETSVRTARQTDMAKGPTREGGQTVENGWGTLVA